MMRLYAGLTRFTHFYAVSKCIFQPTGSTSDITSVVAVGYFGKDVNVKFGDSTLYVKSFLSYSIRSLCGGRDAERQTNDAGERRSSHNAQRHN